MDKEELACCKNYILCIDIVGKIMQMMINGLTGMDTLGERTKRSRQEENTGVSINFIA